jgi:hypothetical protein
VSALELFEVVLLLLPSTAAGAALLVGLLAAAALALSLGMLARSGLDDDARRLADRTGLGLGLALLVLLGLGLRLEPTAHVAGGGSTLLLGLASALTVLGLSGLGGALVFGVIARVHQLPGTRARSAGRGDRAGHRRLARAIAALHALQEAVRRLEGTHAEAVQRSRHERDEAVVRSYRQTAEAIAVKLTSARSLLDAATHAVLRMSCQLTLRDALQGRPDRLVAELGRMQDRGAGSRRTLARALAELERYVERLQVAQWRVRDEASGAAGSVAFEFGAAAGDEVQSIQHALDEMLGSYQRAWHQLQALDLRRQADLGAHHAVAAASTLSDQGAAAPAADQARELALQIASTEAAAERALALSQDGSGALSEAVHRAMALLGTDDGELSEVLRTMRELGEQLGKSGPVR